MELNVGDWVIVKEPDSKKNYPYDWYSPNNREWGMDAFVGKLCEVVAVLTGSSVTLKALSIYGPPKLCFYTFQIYHLEKVEKPSEETQEEV